MMAVAAVRLTKPALMRLITHQSCRAGHNNAFAKCFILFFSADFKGAPEGALPDGGGSCRSDAAEVLPWRDSKIKSI